jgi:hypothetical protein
MKNCRPVIKISIWRARAHLNSSSPDSNGLLIFHTSSISSIVTPASTTECGDDDEEFAVPDNQMQLMLPFAFSTRIALCN